ncbi:MAG: Lsr2 family protein [Micropruina sp.]|uniref:histone-like nucleoid-structuring protein Lsr2 n=1 Tax=Micropruina sp. TaxID=2737536 RepID=UPI0039E3326A
MARKTVVTHIDDIDGTTADETVTFSLDKVDYEIDLSSANAAALREALSAYVGAARRLGGQAARGRGTRPARTDPEQLAAMRRWARENGFEVSDRGRVSKVVRDAYNAAR